MGSDRGRVIHFGPESQAMTLESIRLLAEAWPVPKPVEGSKPRDPTQR